MRILIISIITSLLLFSCASHSKCPAYGAKIEKNKNIC